MEIKTQPKQPNQQPELTTSEALMYYIQNVGKTVFGFAKDLIPRFKKFDADLQEVSIDADKLDKEIRFKKQLEATSEFDTNKR